MLLYNIFTITLPKVMNLWIETIVLISIVLMVISIMIVLTVEILHTTKSISKKRKKFKQEKKMFITQTYATNSKIRR